MNNNKPPKSHYPSLISNEVNFYIFSKLFPRFNIDSKQFEFTIVYDVDEKDMIEIYIENTKTQKIISIQRFFGVRELGVTEIVNLARQKDILRHLLIYLIY
jgi:hypothetical protein